MATWYVKTAAEGGSDSAAGTSEAVAFATLQKAHDSASANDTVYVKAGTYTATVSGTKNLTVIGYGSGQVLFYGATTVGGDAWTVHSGSVWKKTNVSALAAGLTVGIYTISTLSALVFRTAAGGFVKGWQMDSIGEIDSVSTYGIKFWWDDAANTLYAYSATNPNTAFTSVDYTSNTGTAGTVALTSGGIVWTGATLTMRNVDVYGWDGNGVLIYNGSADIANCDISFNREDGYGGHRGTNPAIRRSKMRFNGVRRARDSAAFTDVLPDGDGHSWHAHAGTQTTGIIDEFNYYEGNTKDAFQHIDASTGTCVGAVIKNCNFNIVYNQSGTQTLYSARITAGANDVSGIAFLNTGTVNIYGSTLYGAGTASVPAFAVALGPPANLRGCAIKNWAVGYSGSVPTTESHNGWNVTSVGLTPAGTSFTTTFTLLGADLGIARTSACFGTGVAISGLNFDGAGKARPTTPSVGAMEPYRTGSTSGAGGVVTWLD